MRLISLLLWTTTRGSNSVCTQEKIRKQQQSYLKYTVTCSNQRNTIHICVYEPTPVQSQNTRSHRSSQGHIAQLTVTQSSCVHTHTTFYRRKYWWAQIKNTNKSYTKTYMYLEAQWKQTSDLANIFPIVAIGAAINVHVQYNTVYMYVH